MQPIKALKNKLSENPRTLCVASAIAGAVVGIYVTRKVTDVQTAALTWKMDDQALRSYMENLIEIGLNSDNSPLLITTV